MTLVIVSVLFACSPAQEAEYTRSTTPLGVTDGEGPADGDDDTGDDTGTD